MNALFILGLIILTGFIGRILFKFTGVPESLFMIVIGLLVGPIFNIVDQTFFEGYTSFVATITLVIILLDNGIGLNVIDTVKSLGGALVFTLLVLVFSTLLVGAFFTFIMGWDPLYALLMGVVSSGSTTIVQGCLLPRLSIPQEVGQTLFIESLINDITIITSAVVILQVIVVKNFNMNQIVSVLVQPIIIAILFGLAFTVLWVNVLWKFYREEELSYVFTIGTLFILYSLVEFLGGNAAIAVLVYALSLGNIPLLLEILLRRRGSLGSFNLDIKMLNRLNERFGGIRNWIKHSQFNFTFFIQNFFFVYIGVIFDLNQVDVFLILLCIATISLMFLSRYCSARIFSIFKKNFRPYSTLMASMLARGFTATFVALLPSTMGVDIPLFKEIVLALVFLSTIASMIGCTIYERRSSRSIRPQ